MISPDAPASWMQEYRLCDDARTMICPAFALRRRLSLKGADDGSAVDGGWHVVSASAVSGGVTSWGPVQAPMVAS
jgi:hypothetical protein